MNKSQFNNFPLIMSIDKIKEMTNIAQLKMLEKKYDEIINDSLHRLLLYNIVDDYLDIRDAISNRLSKIHREIELKRYYKNEKEQRLRQKIFIPLSCQYEHKYQNILHPDLRLNNEQINKGYWPIKNEPKEYECGCTSIKYKALCDCDKYTESKCNNILCNSNICPTIKKHAYCSYHYRLHLKQEDLEKQIKTIKNILSESKKPEKCLNNKESRYPWKNI